MLRRLQQRAAAILAGWTFGAGISRAQQPPARVAPTFEALHVAAGELPANWTVSEAPGPVHGPSKLLDRVIYDLSFPRPRRQDSQTIGDGRTSVELLYFDWGARLPDAVDACISDLFPPGRFEMKRAEERVIQSGGVVVIATALANSATGRYVVDRWRRRFGFRMTHEPGSAEPLLQRLRALGCGCCFDADRNRRALEFFDLHRSALGDVTDAEVIEGCLAQELHDWPRCERAFARALELDATVDPLDRARDLDYIHDLHADALVKLDRCDEALREVLGGLSGAYAVKNKCERAALLYRAAACHARAGRPEEAVAGLAESLELDERLKQRAAEDEDFATLRGHASFEKLVAGADPPPTTRRAPAAVR